MKPSHAPADGHRWHPVLMLASLAGALLSALTVWLTSSSAASMLTTDFLNQWTAAHLVWEGRAQEMFDSAAYLARMEALWPGAGWHNWSYPPHLLLFIWPFATFSYPLAFTLWSLAGLGCLHWVVRRRLPLALWLFSPAILVNLVTGQTGFFTAACLLGGCYALQQKRTARAGMLFGLLTIKPQLGLLIPLVLIVLNRWRTFAVAGLTTLALIGLSLCLWGWELWALFYENTQGVQWALLEHAERLYMMMMPGLLPALRIIGVPLPLAAMLHVAMSVPIVFFTLKTLRREALTARSMLLLMLAIMLVTPYAFKYDMTALGISLAVYLMQARTPFSWPKRLLFLLLWLAPALVFFTNAMGLPVIAPLLIMAFVVVYREPVGAAEK